MCEGFPFALSLGSVRKEGPLSQVSAAMHTTHFVPILSMRLTSPYHMFYSILLCTHYSLLPLSIMMGEKSPSLGRHRKGAKYKRISKKEKILYFQSQASPITTKSSFDSHPPMKIKAAFFVLLMSSYCSYRIEFSSFVFGIFYKSKKFSRKFYILALLDAYQVRGFFRETPLLPPHLNLENFIHIHLIHSSGPEPGGQYAVTTCPIRSTKRRSPQGLKQRC